MFCSEDMPHQRLDRPHLLDPGSRINPTRAERVVGQLMYVGKPLGRRALLDGIEEVLDIDMDRP